VQDDARQHIVWLQRFVDPELFPNDTIADYFLSLAPTGYKFFYWIMAKVGFEPLFLAKIMPLILALIATAYLFLFCWEILPNPVASFLSCLFFNQLIWLNDDLVSATPRAFIYPLLTAFLYYLVRRSLIPCLVVFALQGLFYPQLMLVELVLLTVRLWEWKKIKLILSHRFPQLPLLRKANREKYLFWLAGLAVAFLVLFPYITHNSEFGSTVTSTQMQQMPEFGLYGRSQYFGVNPISFILNGSSGLRIPLFPAIVWISIGLPWLLKSKLLLVKSLKKEIKILGQVIIASLIMFLLAHLLLPKLHLPSRYTYHTFRVVMPVATAIILTTISSKYIQSSPYLLCAKGSLLKSGNPPTQLPSSAPLRDILNLRIVLRQANISKIILMLITLAWAIIIIIPAIPHVFLFGFQNWIVGDAPEIYQFLASQPKDTLVVSLAEEINNIPAFSQRSILFGEEFALAYHPAYYQQIQQKIIDIIRAQYSLDSSLIYSVINKYDLDFWLLESNSFDQDYLLQQSWLIHSSFSNVVKEAISSLSFYPEKNFSLNKFSARCSVITTEKLILLDTICLKSVISDKGQMTKDK
jgi:hypothetical protein